VVRRLAAQGVPRAWVEEAVQQRLDRLDSPAARADVALETAYAVLSDRLPLTHEELLDQLRDTDPQLVDNAARELEATLLVGLPENAELAPGLKLVSFPEVEPVGESKRHRHVNWPADLSTFSADAQLAEAVTATSASAMRTRDVVGLFVWRDGTRRLLGRDGSVLEMEAQQWVDGDELVATIDAAVPAPLHIPMPDREVTFHRMSPAERSAIAFGRVANTRVGLLSMLGVVAVLALWALIGDHVFIGVVLLLLGGALGAQLRRVESEREPVASGAPPPTSATSATT
jgi:hypothetical protein